MSKYEDPTETLLERSLHNQAVNAPGDDFLLDRVQHRVKARRNTKAVLAGAIACGATIAAVAAFIPSLNEHETPAANGKTGFTTAAADWRWESYGGIEVQVPPDWGYGPGIDYPQCLLTKPMKPVVSRKPMSAPSIKCGQESLKLEYRADSLTFDAIDREPGLKMIDNGWAEQTKMIAGTKITVFSNDAALRERILGSARPINGTDQYGCPTDRAFTADPSLRPEDGGSLSSVGTVTSISVCRYLLDQEGRVAARPLISSGKVTGEQAGAAVKAILDSPQGTGPNTPSTCMYKYGDEMAMLIVRGSAGTKEVFVRYSGCDHNGLDDGTTRWKLTRENLAPAFTEPNRPNQGSGAIHLFWPR